MTANRRLAAIMVADVVGYSRMMERDEAGTLAALKERRKSILDPVVREHGGRIVKVMGDGVLVEFGSAVNAVKGAVELQKQMATANEGVEGPQRIVLRIGINLVDVIGEGSDIYGDGVNIAARLESLAIPGGVVASGQIYEAARNKVKVTFVDMGQPQLKNITIPVRAYRIELATPLDAPSTSSKKDRRVSIAVLPFDNMSGDSEQGYFSDGITEDVITELSKYRELIVIARNSSFQFRGRNADLRDIGRSLGADFIVEGSVRRSDNQVRVTAQLIDATNGAHIWAERYDRPIHDIFAIQDEITQMVTSRVSRRMKEEIIHRARAKPTDSISAYEHFLRAFQLTGRYDTQLQAGEPARRAVELDPNFAAALAVLSFTEVNKWSFNDDEGHLATAVKLAHEAIALDPSEPLGHTAGGFAKMHLRQYDDSRRHLDDALALNPNDTIIRGLRALLNSYTQRHAKALMDIEEALRRDPYAADWLWDARGIVMLACGKYDDVISSYQRAQYVAQWGLAHLTVALVELNRLPEAAATYLMLLERHADWLNGRWIQDPSVIFCSFESRSDIDRYVSAIQRAKELSGSA